VIDGDTIELTGGDRLRLLGIDCPERGEPFYDSALAFIRQTVLDKHIRVEYSRRRRDGYGRILGFIYIDSVFINDAIIRNGLGNVYLFNDNPGDDDNLKKLISAQNEAIDKGRGIWSQSYQEEDYYLARAGSHRFHRPFCRSVSTVAKPTELLRFESRLEAFRLGYSACRNCRP
jgi:micrococcal nuclease